jgi:hypothetical protein
MSGHQNAGQNHNIKIANSSFEDVVEFRSSLSLLYSSRSNYRFNTIGYRTCQKQIVKNAPTTVATS